MKAMTETNRVTKGNNDAGEIKVELKPLNIQVLKLSIIGDSPLILHAWSNKAITGSSDNTKRNRHLG